MRDHYENIAQNMAKCPKSPPIHSTMQNIAQNMAKCLKSRERRHGVSQYHDSSAVTNKSAQKQLQGTPSWGFAIPRQFCSNKQKCPKTNSGNAVIGVSLYHDSSTIVPRVTNVQSNVTDVRCFDPFLQQCHFSSSLIIILQISYFFYMSLMGLFSSARCPKNHCGRFGPKRGQNVTDFFLSKN